MSDPSQHSQIDKATVDRWQVLGGMAGVASVVITLISAATSTFPVAFVAGVALAVIGVALLFRWGRDVQRPRTAKRFALPVVITIVGSVLASVSATLAAAPGTPQAVRSTETTVTTTQATTAKTSATSGPQATTPTLSGELSERQGQIHLTYEYGVDLDSDAPDWGYISGAGRVVIPEKLDLFVGIGHLETKGDMALVGTTGDEVGHAKCASSTGRVKEVALQDLKVSDVYCVKTNEGRSAKMTVVEKPVDRDDRVRRLTVDVVVWKKAAG